MSKPFTLEVDGMHCGGCVRRVTKALEKLGNGIKLNTVDIGKVVGEYEDGVLQFEQVRVAIQSAGYSVRRIAEEG